MTTFLTLGGRVQCTQCRAMSKRTRLRCRAPAIKGKAVCRFHGDCCATLHTFVRRQTNRTTAFFDDAEELVLTAVSGPK